MPATFAFLYPRRYDFLHVTGEETLVKSLNNMPKIIRLLLLAKWGIWVCLTIPPSLESR